MDQFLEDKENKKPLFTIDETDNNDIVIKTQQEGNKEEDKESYVKETLQDQKDIFMTLRALNIVFLGMSVVSVLSSFLSDISIWGATWFFVYQSILMMLIIFSIWRLRRGNNSSLLLDIYHLFHYPFFGFLFVESLFHECDKSHCMDYMGCFIVIGVASFLIPIIYFYFKYIRRDSINCEYKEPIRPHQDTLSATSIVTSITVSFNFIFFILYVSNQKN